MHERHAPVPFSPSLPDVSDAHVLRYFHSESQVALFVVNAKPWAARANGASLLTYPFVFAVYQQDVGPIYFVTLEESITGTKCLGVFDGSGAHLNFGTDETLEDEENFVRKALLLAQERLGENFIEVTPQNETPTRNSP